MILWTTFYRSLNEILENESVCDLRYPSSLVRVQHVLVLQTKCKEIEGVAKVSVCLIQRVRLVQVLLSCKVS